MQIEKEITEEEDAAGDGAAGLPPRSVRRWVASRKAAVVHAVLGGKLTAEQACRSYDLSGEELQGWIAAVRNHGEGALKATSLRKFR